MSLPPISLINPLEFMYAAQASPAASSHNLVATIPSPVSEPETTQTDIEQNKSRDGEKTHNLPKRYSDTSSFHNIINQRRQKRTRRKTAWNTNSKKKREELRECARSAASFFRGFWPSIHQPHRVYPQQIKNILQV